ncbi:MAG: preprotein translocase subunit SecG [Bacilli bacterium]|nr:preprotein translocase subunit SecG [Bacilli bacterium]
MGALDIIFLVIAVIIIILSLLQGGKSDGASGAITGGGLNVFAKQKERGSELVISWMTFGFAIAFFLIAVLIRGISVSKEASESTETAMAILNLLNLK